MSSPTGSDSASAAQVPQEVSSVTSITVTSPDRDRAHVSQPQHAISEPQVPVPSSSSASLANVPAQQHRGLIPQGQPSSSSSQSSQPTLLSNQASLTGIHQSTSEQEPPSSSSSSSNPNLRRQQSQDLLSLREFLNSGDDFPAEPAPGTFHNTPSEGAETGITSGSKRTRIVNKIRSVLKKKSKDDNPTTSTPTDPSVTSALPNPEQNEEENDADVDEPENEPTEPTEFDAKASLTRGPDGKFRLTPSSLSHNLLTDTTPSSPPRTLRRTDSQETIRAAPPPQPSTRTRNRARSRNVTILPPQHIIAPFLPRARGSSEETIKPATSSQITGAMSSSTSAIPAPQRIPLVCPAWDRVVDITWRRRPDLTWTGAAELSAFRTSLALYARDSGHTPTPTDLAHPYFQLPDRVRYMVAKYLVPDSPRPIRLNNGTRLYAPVWLDGHFDSLESVLRAVEPYTSVCWALRADVLMTLANTRRFHVVLSPFSGPLLDPAAHRWFDAYAGHIQHLTLEVDMSKLGFGAEAAAADLRPLMTKIRPRVEAYAAAQKRRAVGQEMLLHQGGFFSLDERTAALRGGLTTVHELRVAARRYYGVRPGGSGRTPEEYAADKYLAVLAPLKALCGKVDVFRAAGVSGVASRHLLACVWEGMSAEAPLGTAVAGRFRGGAVRATRPSDFWPALPGQASFFDDGGGGDQQQPVFVRHPFAYEDGELGLYLDESMVGEGAKKGDAPVRSVILPGPAALGRGESRDARGAGGVPGPSDHKGKGKEKAVEVEDEEVPAWDEEVVREMAEVESRSGSSSTETEPFPELPDAELQLALLAAFEVDRSMRRSAEGVPAPETAEQGEAAGEQMPGPSSGGARVMGRVAGRLHRKMSQLNLGVGKSSKE